MTLLATKITLPLLRPDLVDRSRLLERLTAVSNHKLTLLTAPAGFGKTTLLTSWLQSPAARSENMVSAWLSLDKSDNDFAQFFTYFIAAVQTAVPDCGQASQTFMRSPQPPSAAALLIPLLNELTAVVQTVVIIVDDFHLVTSEAIQEAIAFFLERQPAHVHLIIASRRQPSLPLSRWRARGQLLEIGAADLRFTANEAERFFQQTMHLPLPTEQVEALEAHTEGWVAGLQLAALAIGRKGQLPQSFSGRHHYVLDYLVDEVLSQQLAGVREFLLQTAVCGRLTADLCDAITGMWEWDLDFPAGVNQRAQSMLTYLVEANLFIIPLDVERTWFRYHHLFAEFLQARLRAGKSEGEIAAYHLRAATWYQQNGLYAEALDHAFAAGATGLAADLIVAAADALWTRGSLTTLHEWLKQLPAEAQQKKPLTAVYLAWVLFFKGQTSPDGNALFAQADAILRSLEDKFEHLDDETQGMVFAVRTALSSMQNNPARTIEFAEKAMALLPASKLLWHSVVSISRAYAYEFTGQTALAMSAFSQAARQARQGGNLSGALFAYGRWAFLLRQKARLHEAEQVYQEALRAAQEAHGEGLSISGQIYLGIAALKYEWNQLGEASLLLQRGIDQFESGGFPVIEPLFLLARLYVCQGELDQAALAAAQADEQLKSSRDPRLNRNNVLAAQARYWLASGQAAAVEKWSRQSQLPFDPPDLAREVEYLTWVRFQFTQREGEPTVAILAALFEAAAANGRTASQIEIRLLQALERQMSGQNEAALSFLREAVSLAQPGGFVRMFLDEGVRCRALCRAGFQTWSSLNGFDRAVLATVEKLLLEWNKELAAEGTAVQPLVEPLSQRELEILQLICDGRSNQQIADELVVALSTIKWHINNIYGKLGVRSRSQAMARARELNIQSHP